MAVTFYGANLVVDQGAKQLEQKTGVISELVFKKELDIIEEWTELLSEDAAYLKARNVDELQDLFQRAFLTQHEHKVDYLAVLDNNNEFVFNISTELEEYEEIARAFRSNRYLAQTWNWLIEVDQNKAVENVLVFFNTPIMDANTGRVAGTLISGMFLRDNLSLVSELATQSEANTVAIIFDGTVLSTVGDWPRTRFQELFDVDATRDFQDGLMIQSKPLMNIFPDGQLQTLTLLQQDPSRNLKELYLFAGVAAVLLIVGLSLLANFVIRRQILSPLNSLTSYAGALIQRDENPEVPISNVKEFNEVSQTMAGILTDLQESERRIEDFLSVISDSIWETDSEHRYRLMSTGPNLKKLGIHPEDLIGKKRQEVGVLQIVDMSWEEYEELLNKHELFRNLRFKWILGDDEESFISTSGKPLFDADGNFAGYRGVSSDITSEVQAEQKTKHIEEQLRQSQKLEVVGQLTGGIAHDFNNLLSIVMGNLELALEQKDLSPPMKQYLQDAMVGVEKGANLTHQLLAYSRQQKLAPKRLLSKEVIEGVKPLLERALGEGVEMSLYLEDTWFIMADPTELENALLNLVVNARDAMNGVGKLSIESFNIQVEEKEAQEKPDVKPGEYVCIIVSDTGAGISEENLSRITEPFFTTKEVGKGSGLGLSMVFGFAKQSGGHLDIYSELGKGTSVKLLLPRASSSEDPIHEKRGRGIIKAGAGQTVLVIEDNDKLRELIEQQLISIGYHAVASANATEAFAKLKTEAIDIVLSDVVLPGGISGIEIYKAVKENYPDIKILLMSGFTGKALEFDESLPSHVTILMKPFTKVKLSEALADNQTDYGS
ncbi:ATP-binding protein [Sneathiella limimaris]|uniref:ATP-binding protein n=1 Tax=Sneathiella limimaris TaxID=1964213 RepID=UPI00146A391D|nr:ATP-binding protein [Sneathiella limimaris]